MKKMKTIHSFQNETTKLCWGVCSSGRWKQDHTRFRGMRWVGMIRPLSQFFQNVSSYFVSNVRCIEDLWIMGGGFSLNLAHLRFSRHPIYPPTQQVQDSSPPPLQNIQTGHSFNKIHIAAVLLSIFPVLHVLRESMILSSGSEGVWGQILLNWWYINFKFWRL